MSPPYFAAIVTFRPTQGLIDLIDALYRHSIFVLVVANADNGIAKDILSHVSPSTPHEVIFNAENKGVGEALNQALQYGRTNGFEAMFAFDQDTQPLESFFDELGNHERYCAENKNITVIAPTLVTRQGMEIRADSYFGREDAGYFEVGTAITSGSLYDIDRLLSAGGFAADFFIDYIDHDICLRLRRHGYLTARSVKSRVIHQIGSHRTIGLFGKSFSLTEYNPHRHYFIARNRTITYNRYIKRFPFWVLRDMAISGVWTLITLSFEAERTKKLSSTLRGVWHGIRGISGNPDGYFVNGPPR